MAAPPVCPASCGLRLGAAVPFRPRSAALPPPLAWPRPPLQPLPAGSSPAASACRRPNPPSHRRKIMPRLAGPRGRPRRIQPARIAVQQKRHHHPRVKRRLPEPAHIAARNLLEIEALPHQFNDEPRDMAFRHEILHIWRQKQRLIDIPRAKILAHGPTLNKTRPEFKSDYPDRLLVHRHGMDLAEATNIIAATKA